MRGPRAASAPRLRRRAAGVSTVLRDGGSKGAVPRRAASSEPPKAPAPRLRPIVLRGCRQHNLKGFDLELKRGAWTAISGVSGSGKSSLAFDSLYAEGQRRYVESFGAYARQFLDRMPRPQIDAVEGIPPAIAIAQGNDVRTARSTVATVTELGDYLKIVYARLGVRHCDRCDRPIHRRTPEDVATEILRDASPEASAMVGFEPAGFASTPFEEMRDALARKGFVRAMNGAAVTRVEAMTSVVRDAPFVVILDRIPLRADGRSRLVEALEQAFAHGEGTCAVVDSTGEIRRFDTSLRCADCGLRFADPKAAQFSFNHASGACATCSGFGRTLSIDEDLVIPDRKKSLDEGAIKPWTTPSTAWERRDLKKWCDRRGVRMDKPYEELSETTKKWLWEGEPGGYSAKVWWGLRGWFQWLETRTYKMHVRVLLSRYRSAKVCAGCGGTRFRPEVLKVRVDGRAISDAYRLPLSELRAWLEGFEPAAAVRSAIEVVLGEIRSRLRYLCEVGLGYLTLDRSSRTLSGGEMERVNLTTAVGSRLVNSLFVLDEPSVGLHPRDNDRLIGILRRLVAHGNTVVVVEHDPALLLAADELVDMGPGPGESGGTIVFQGPPSTSGDSPESRTGAFLSGRRRIEVPARRRSVDGPAVEVRGARAHNLKGIDARFPIGALTVVTGVSGSGKSTLVEEVLVRNLLRARGERTEEVGACDGVTGGDHFSEIVMVDASPIGRSPKSTVATACGAYERIRKALAALPEAKAAKFRASTLSFNTKGGRCEACEGAGFERVEMQFLADVFLPCNECGGDRFRPEVRRVKLRGKTIGEILNFTILEALEFFEEDDATINRRLRPLVSVGLGYLRLGQSVTTLSGGEAQRLKLATAVGGESFADEDEEPTRARSPRGRSRGSLFLFDEPTTGLHLDDVEKLLHTLRQLLRHGHTVVAIEHHLDFMAHADWVIDLGPEAGAAGGQVVACGTPEQIAAHQESITGAYLRAHGIRPAPAKRELTARRVSS